MAESHLPNESVETAPLPLETTAEERPASEPIEAEEAEALHHAIGEPETEPERDTSGDFREPHPEEPGEGVAHEEIPPSQFDPLSEAEDHGHEAAAELPPAAAPVPTAPRERAPERPAPPEFRRPEPRPWVKPADFRPAEASAISQAVAHATEIAEALRHTLDELDEILELVELAERQKLADEREIEELRRALRRIQPQRHQPNQPPHQPHQRPPQPYEPHLQRGPRHDDQRGRRDQNQRPEERQPRREASENPPARSPEPRPPEAPAAESSPRLD